uniref:Uncharacterized protein n=1 Tax=Cryptomonas curvata TaxID=233186 RepID=A0A7S0QGH7_9CRYP
MLGVHHEAVAAARARHRDLREAVGRELRLCEEEVHRQAVEAAGFDESALKAAVRAAIAGLDPAHVIVQEGKLRLREFRLTRLSEEREELVTEVELELVGKLKLADLALLDYIGCHNAEQSSFF